MAFFDENPWVGYASRDYRVMKNDIIAKMQNPVTGIPEITDHSESNPFIKRLSVWCGINEQLGYYVDNKGREVFLLVALLYRSIVNIAKQYDYRIRGLIAATGTVKFTSNIPVASNYLIPVGTVVATETGIQFETIANATILAGQTSITVAVRQWTKVAPTVIGQSNGQQNQTFEIGENVVDGSVTVTVNNITQYTGFDSFVFAMYDDNAFMHQMNQNLSMEVVFGDGINGAIPPNGQDISIGWYQSQGAAGNVGVGMITEFVTVLVPPVGAKLSVTNDTNTINGTDAEGITELKKNIPLSLRTLYRAVTDKDYVDVTELAPGVARAGVDYKCGKYVDVYIAPNGGGIANQTLLTDTFNYLDVRKTVTTFPRLNSAGLVVIEYEFLVYAKPNYYNNDVKASVLQTLIDFHSVQNQKIKGKVFIGDIYQKIENTTGVDHSEVLKMRPIPYARPLNQLTPQLVWNRQQYDSAANATYRITFISPTVFRLLRNTSFLGNFTTGVMVNAPDLDLIVPPGSYVAGNAYEFKTYMLSNSVILDEPSLPAFDINNAVITVTGGLV